MSISHVEQFTGKEAEQLTNHMVDMHFGLPTRGVEYRSLVGIDVTLRAFREEYGEQLGLTCIAAHIATIDRELRVVAHVSGFADDAKEVVGYVARIVEEYGIEVPLGIPEFTVSRAALPEAL